MLTTLEQFGKRLRTLRKSRGLTIEELGQAVGLGYKHVADLERAVKTPSFEAIERLAEALGAAPHELFQPDEPEDRRVNAEESLRQAIEIIQSQGSLELKLFLSRVLQEAVHLIQPGTSGALLPAGSNHPQRKSKSR